MGEKVTTRAAHGPHRQRNLDLLAEDAEHHSAVQDQSLFRVLIEGPARRGRRSPSEAPR